MMADEPRYRYPFRRRTRERKREDADRTRTIREATCAICGRWFRIPQAGTITCGTVCRDQARAIREGPA
jgi:hypothetical protein